MILAVRATPLTSLFYLQVRFGAAVHIKCGRIASALLPAAELLLRGVLDVRQQIPCGINIRDAVMQARCACTRDLKGVKASYSQECLLLSKAAQFLLGSLPVCALPFVPPVSH